MSARKPSAGKRSAKKTVRATEQKFGKAARVAAQQGGKKPVAWQQSEKLKRDLFVPLTQDEALDRAIEIASRTASHGSFITATRTVDGSASDVFRAFNDPMRRHWCHERLYSVRSAVAPRMLRVVMPDQTVVTVAIQRKGNTRTLVTVEQSQLPDAGTAERARQAWKLSLDRLAAYLDE